MIFFGIFLSTTKHKKIIFLSIFFFPQYFSRTKHNQKRTRIRKLLNHVIQVKKILENTFFPLMKPDICKKKKKKKSWIDIYLSSGIELTRDSRNPILHAHQLGGNLSNFYNMICIIILSNEAIHNIEMNSSFLKNCIRIQYVHPINRLDSPKISSINRDLIHLPSIIL